MIIALFGLVRLYLAVDHPDDVLFGVALGVGASPVKSLVRTPGRCRATMRRGLIWREAGGTPSG